MLISPVHDLLPVPAGNAERWLHCCGLKTLLDQYLKIRLSLRGGPASWRRFGYRASVQLPDPLTFDGAWAQMAILIRRHPRWGGLGPDDDVLWHRSIPATIFLHPRASRTADGELAVQWCVPEGPPPVPYHAEPSSGLIVPAEGAMELRLILPRVTPAAAGDIAEVSGAEWREQPRRLITVGRRFHDDTCVPYLRLSGRWLGALGFHEGGAIDVRTEPGRITLDVLAPVGEEPAGGTAPA